jgi:hypothetical protein
MKNVLLILVIVLFTVACSKKRDLGNHLQNDLKFSEAELAVLFKMRKLDGRISVEEATKRAYEVIALLDGEAAVL